MVLDEKHVLRRAPEVLGRYREVGLGRAGLHDTRRDCQTHLKLKEVGYVVYCSGGCDYSGCYGVITHAIVCPTKFINKDS